jgi:ABC-type Fe3+ transport system substrate-binding protein
MKSSAKRFLYRYGCRLLGAVALAATLAGCGSPKSANNGVAGGTAADVGDPNTLLVISPHSRDIQDEFQHLFETKYPGSHIKWVTMNGGTSDLVRFVTSQFAAKSNKDQGINIDVFFGGGAETFLELDDDHTLQALTSNFGVPATLNGVPLVGKDNHWVAAVLSGFGILYNKTYMTRDNLPPTQTWADLGNPALRGRIMLADPRHSGSAHAAYEIILQTNGWQRGWEIFTAMAANASKFEQGSSDLLQDVQNGEAVAAPAIDFYARSAIEKAGAGQLGYAEPKGQHVVTPDPIGILKGAPHLKLAQEFVALVMSPEGQRLWFLKKGTPGGPVQHDLLREPALPSLYKEMPADAGIGNPFTEKNAHPYDANKATVRRRVLDDLIGAILIDNHDALQASWAKNSNVGQLTFVPVTEDQATKLAAKWKDETFRQSTITGWREAAAKKFGGG